LVVDGADAAAEWAALAEALAAPAVVVRIRLAVEVDPGEVDPVVEVPAAGSGEAVASAVAVEPAPGRAIALP
jgi:hypothetical protein